MEVLHRLLRAAVLTHGAYNIRNFHRGATFFGMNFFDLDDENNRIVSTSMIWIYIVASVILTAATFIIYHMLLEGGPFGKRKMVLPKAGEWNQLKIWVRKRSTFAEKNALAV
ncbi:hypothetical protein K4K54_003026 [Colletotrichum sp. SAR 10_86]|nr:hypothetical protein K4K54_003026 [Colletotrichum sp. SAR 10_86]